ncbi:hypothetical protein, conserved [Babesia bigemina]|uniref:C3H1-type domain-containing protein n=1 Tax=Babesia bigemina TaxID=5866 RepID=A0A061BKG1_BABBI|nr:hypothetical protein, conserved [Babesia bigemina]CDR71927.1 hypothetical protein, conserved [Babesia bigemina]|eukprot:XP_012770869.1 hypothetical protein, conserved [Babesia bigemina]
MTPLENLEKTLNNHASLNMVDKLITDQLSTWRGFSSLYVQEVEKSEAALVNVDDNLKNTVAPRIELLRQVAQNFWNSVNDDSFLDALNELDSKFSEIPQNVNQHIANQIQDVQRELNEKLHNIGTEIKNVKKEKNKHMKEIKRAVTSAQQLADKLVGTSANDFEKYKNDIKQQFEQMKAAVEKLTGKKGASSTLLENFGTVQTEVSGLEADVRHGLEELMKTIENIDIGSVTTQALSDLGKAKSDLDALAGTITDPSVKLKTKYENGVGGFNVQFAQLYRQASDIKTEEIRNGLNKLADVIGGPLSTLQNIHNTIHEELQSKLQDVAGELNDQVQELKKGINDKLGAYIKEIVGAVMKAIQTADPSSGDVGDDQFTAKAGPGIAALQEVAAFKQILSGPGIDLQAHLEMVLDDIREAIEIEGMSLDSNVEDTNPAVTALKNDLISKVDAAVQSIQTFAKEAANKGSEKFRDAIGVQINGQPRTAESGIYSQISNEMKKLKHPDTVGDTHDEFLIAFKAFESKLKRLTTSANAAKSAEEDIQKLVDSVTNAVNNLHQSITTFDDAAKKQIKAAARKAIDDALEKFVMDKIITTNIDVATLMTEFDTSKKSLTFAIEEIEKQLGILKTFPSIVDGKRIHAEQTMQTLKNEIEQILAKIKDINTPISAAESAFNTAMEALEGSLSSAQGTVKVIMPLLKSKLQSRVNNAFNEVEEYVQKMFNAQRNADFKSLKDCITERIPQIKDIIDRDSASGLKGLMNKFQEPLNRLHSSGTQLRTYAGKVKLFCEDFFVDFKNQPDLTDHSPLLTPLADALSSLLSTMHDQRHFHADVSRKLADLQTQLDRLTPSEFAEASPLLNVVKAGVRAFHGELAKQYVSRYSGERFTDEVVKDKRSSETKTVKSPAKAGDETEITEYGRKCAKVFLTSLATLSNDFKVLTEKCNNGREWSTEQINLYTDIGKFFGQRGYNVSTERDSHDGTLRNKTECQGANIKGFLTQMLNTAAINKLTDCLRSYYYVCHVRLTPPKTPTTVFAMLKWCAGLRYNAMLSKVEDYTKTLFSKPKKYEDRDYKDISVNDLQLVGTSTIKPRDLCDALYDVCRYAETVLITILGHGHNDGVYACDFSANEDGFSYPTAPGSCFDMLVDILNRLYRQLFFVYRQCRNDDSCSGWRDCLYGNAIGGSSFNCNTKQCANQKCKQTCNQIHNQMGDQHPKCGIKSPLQSFLEDGLPGFLPHEFKKPGCKLECTVSNHRGLPCNTPMGFPDISVMASHTRDGVHLMNVLRFYCGNESSPLTKLCAQLTCLLQMPPQTLGDIFAFYYGYIANWSGGFYERKGDEMRTQTSFRAAIAEANFGNPYQNVTPDALISSDNHTDKHLKGDLCSITSCVSGSDKPCGLYIRSVTFNTFSYYSSKHKGNHLSWIVYITETFCDLLKKLYDECCAKCDKRGSRCHDKRCVETCQVKYSDKEEDRKKLSDHSHEKECRSIITCRNTHPTLYKYGFTFGNPWALNGLGKDTAAKRTCKDFCEALKLMLVENSVLIELRKQIDDFLWAIRLNFSITVLVLWLLSVLYLLHIMVIRLDLLHIKSHLHSPSSHRIAAQSLLAAARVNKLNRVFYLQP